MAASAACWRRLSGSGSAPAIQASTSLRIGLRTAEDLLYEDGAQTIYRPSYWTEEGMLVVARSAPDADVCGGARGDRRTRLCGCVRRGHGRLPASESAPAEVVHEVILAAIAASVPAALVPAEGAHNQ